MSATTHGAANLFSLVEQPGSSFTTTRVGFDTGRRVFKCWASVVATLEPRRGSQDDTYQGMLVDVVTTTFNTAGVATLEVSYLGLKDESILKEDDWNYSVGYSPNGATFTTVVNGSSVTMEESVFLPEVTHTYITGTLPTNKPGDFATPAKYADLIPATVVTIPELAQTWTYNAYLKGWKLAGRTIKQIGTRYEISDTHNYVFKFSTITIT